MPFTTASRCRPEFIDQPRILELARGIELERLVGQHVGEADDGVERRAQLVAHGRDEAALGGAGALGFRARGIDGQLLRLALAHIAQHRDHFALGRLIFTGGVVERPAAHFRPDEAAGMPRIGLAADAEFERAVFAARGGIGERGEIGRAVGDMDAVEQAMAQQLVGGTPSSASAAGETNSTAPLRPWRTMTSVMLRASSR